MESLVSSALAFLVSLVVGGVALFAAAQLLHRGKGNGLEHALWTAVAGAVVWALLSWVPLVGGLLALAGWIAVLAWRYPGGLLRATVMGVLAWIIAVGLLWFLGGFGVGGFDVVGIPGV